MPLRRFEKILHEHYPHAIPQTVFVGRSYHLLWEAGFDEHNTIACVGVCRDELTHSLADKLAAAWGEAFNLSSLAAMVLLGRTGFDAAVGHAPMVGGRRRYVFFSLPHIALDENGGVGICERPGLPEPSRACGALYAFAEELARGEAHLDLDPDDLEQSLLKQKLAPHLPEGRLPSLEELTELARGVALADLKHLIELALDPAKVDYAIVSGIQIHGPLDRDFVSPEHLHVVVDGEARDLTRQLQRPILS